MEWPLLRAIYARVSTINHGQDASLQTRELQQYAVARGWQVAGEWTLALAARRIPDRN